MNLVYYKSGDFSETADSNTLKQIARTRELTRENYFSDYGDIEKRTSILRKLLGGIGENSVIGAGSVVTRPISSYYVAVGNPCRVVILIQTGKGGSMKYKHIVFDIDGTLIDTEYAVLHSLQETIKGLSGRSRRYTGT